MKYICPLCKSPLTKAHYHRVLKIQAQEEKLQKGEVEKLHNQILAAKNEAASAKRRAREFKLKAKEDIANTHRSATLAERERSGRLLRGYPAKMKKLQDRIKMLESGTTPQIIGLADEGILVERLRKEFPTDRIQHAGKGGDVLHFVVFNREDVGCIVYECKHTDHISGQHISQTVLAKRTRNANFAILVTTGKRKGFSGLDQESGAFIVAPGGVLTLAHFCRDGLVSMAKLQLDAVAKGATAKRLMDYITSPTCKTPLEQAILQTEKAGKKLMQEVQQHCRDWQERYQTYQTIFHDVSHIQKNIGLVLDGQKPMALEKPKFTPLSLPSVDGH